MIDKANALKDLTTYATTFNQRIAHGRKDISEMMDCDVSELPRGITDACFVNDDHLFYCTAFVKNGKLYRFGIERRGEDPGDVFKTSLEALVKLGDPWLYV